MSEENFNQNEFLEKLKNLIDDAAYSEHLNKDEYPKEAMPLGTYVRCKKYNCLGIIVDAFYGDTDKVGTKIIIYSVLSIPSTSVFVNSFMDDDKHYLSNEYEYDVIGYLMIPPANVPEIKKSISGDFFI